MDKKLFKNISLRAFAGAIMAVILSLFVVMAFFVTEGLHSDNTGVSVNGAVRFAGGMGLQSPVYLNGDWEVFEEYSGNVPKEDDSPEYMSLPIGSIVQAQKKAA